MSVTRWDSTSNTVPFRSLSEADVIALVNRALSGNSHHTTTYKYAFFKSLLDNVFNVDLQTMLLPYENLASRFTSQIFYNTFCSDKIRAVSPLWCNSVHIKHETGAML